MLSVNCLADCPKERVKRGKKKKPKEPEPTTALTTSAMSSTSITSKPRVPHKRLQLVFLKNTRPTK